MTAAFLGASAGIIEDGFENSAAYLHGWLEVFKVKDHKTWLVKAASEAQKAADYILAAAFVSLNRFPLSRALRSRSEREPKSGC